MIGRLHTSEISLCSQFDQRCPAQPTSSGVSRSKTSSRMRNARPKKGRHELGAGSVPAPSRDASGERITYPFVTTGGGGGALPLPIWALAVTLRRASTAAVARASFFMKDPFS